MKPLPWSVEERSRNIHVIRVELPKVGDEAWGLLQSDVHWDNPKCDRVTLREHLNEAVDRRAFILDNGDWFCAMQGKWDKRSNKSDLRPEHQTATYLDSLVDTSAEYLAPFAANLAVRGFGNHETGILKRHETHLTERLVERLKAKSPKSPVKLGGYGGWVIIEARYGHTKYQPIKLHYHHGHGGGGPVTRGVIQTNRMAVYLADADIVWTGHTHDTWQVPIPRVKLNQDNTAVQHIRQVHIRTAGYKEEYGDGYGGWHVERGGAPKPVSAAWLRVWYARANQIEFELTEAR